MIDFVANLLRSTDTLPQGSSGDVLASADLGDVLWSGPASLGASIDAAYVQHAWLVIGTLAFAVALAAFVRLPVRGERRSLRQFGLVSFAAAVSFACVGSLIGASLRNLHVQAHGVYAVTPTRIVHFDPVDGRTDFPASSISQVRQDGKGKFVVTASGRTLVLEARDMAKLGAALDFLIRTAAGGSGLVRPTLG